MTKAQYVKVNVRLAVWKIMKRVYGIPTDEPQSEKQAAMLEEVSDYVADKLSPMSREELEQAFKEGP